jgi:hypothetical protein
MPYEVQTDDDIDALEFELRKQLGINNEESDYRVRITGFHAIK